MKDKAMREMMLLSAGGLRQRKSQIEKWDERGQTDIFRLCDFSGAGNEVAVWRKMLVQCGDAAQDESESQKWGIEELEERDWGQATDEIGAKWRQQSKTKVL